MKNQLSVALITIIMMAGMSASLKAKTNLNHMTGDYTALTFTINIPDQWKQIILREDGNETATFKFDNGNTAPLFLFSVSKIPEQQWAKVKSQMPDAVMMLHKNGSIYFIQKTSKENIKGPKSDLYSQIYKQLDGIIASIQISE